jgi:hypothetical protein
MQIQSSDDGGFEVHVTADTGRVNLRLSVTWRFLAALVKAVLAATGTTVTLHTVPDIVRFLEALAH